MAGADSIGLSGLLASQRLLDIAGQNITNAGTPGYHRQVANLAMRSSGLEVGLGVEITQVRRVIEETLERAITRNTYSVNDLSTQLTTMRQIEAQLMPQEGSLLDLWEDVRNQVVTLVGKPDDVASQRVLLNQANALAGKINSLSTELHQVRLDLDKDLNNSLTTINNLTDQIAKLNAQIARATIQGGDVNNTSDQRDQLINQLAELIDVRVVPQEYGVVNLFAGSVPLVINDHRLTLRMIVDGNDKAQIYPDNYPGPLTVIGGEVNGLLELRNNSVRDVIDRVEQWSTALVRTLDTLQATGLGTSGPFQVLFGQRPVDNVSLPLASAGLTFPPQAGTLFVSVTNQATGARTLHSIAIDPETQNLNDIASAISAVPNLQGIVNPQSRTLTIVAQPGFAFDFAGRLPTSPETVAITGTAAPTITGNYSGAANDQFTFSVVGNGTVGVTSDLKLEARNNAGQLIGTWNIGQGYEPGSELSPLQGIRLRIGAGTFSNGDSFATRVVAQSDTSGVLAALGINSFFQGDAPGTLQVRPDLVLRPELLSGSRTGNVADGTNWKRLADALEAPNLASGSSNLQKFITDLIADVGSQVQDLDQRESALASLGEGLEVERQNVSGVDPNQELMRMLQYQRSFQMSAKFITVVNETLQELMQLV